MSEKIQLETHLLTDTHKAIYKQYPKSLFVWIASPGACKACRERHNQRYTYREIERMGRPHPNCNCTVEVAPEFLESIGGKDHFDILNGLLHYYESSEKPIFLDVKTHFPQFNNFNPDLFPDLRNTLYDAYKDCEDIIIDMSSRYDDSSIFSAFGNVMLRLQGTFSPKRNLLRAELTIDKDKFDFDKSNHRTAFKELLTEAGREYIDGKPYYIYFMGGFHYEIKRAWGSGHNCK